MHLLLDIEALGRRPGSAPVELAAATFDPHTGDIRSTFHTRIIPLDGLTADVQTLAWHREHRTWPFPDGSGPEPLPLRRALLAFCQWLHGQPSQPTLYWSWGSTYDFPLLDAAFRAIDHPPPWHYSQCCCARTIWKCAFPGLSPEPRCHHALQDVLAAIPDLIHARNTLRGPTPAIPSPLSHL